MPSSGLFADELSEAVVLRSIILVRDDLKETLLLVREIGRKLVLSFVHGSNIAYFWNNGNIMLYYS